MGDYVPKNIFDKNCIKCADLQKKKIFIALSTWVGMVVRYQKVLLGIA